MLLNPIAKFIDKPPQDFQRKDILKYIKDCNIDYLDLKYPGLDSRLKSLRFPITSIDRIEQVLADGERVDGSSIFENILRSSQSDLYVIPVYSTAFVNPFYPNTLSLCCFYFNQKGEPSEVDPSYILQKACNKIRENFQMDLYLGPELEFYLLKQPSEKLFLSTPQKGYHETEPFIKNMGVIEEIVSTLARLSCNIKYAHSEVGFIPDLESPLPEINGSTAEQYEIEFMPTKAMTALWQVLISKWVIRNIAYKHGLISTFAPKLEDGMAGSGMHVHMEMRKDNKNIMLGEDKNLSDTALCMIGGLCEYASSLNAFGNTIASSYFRLVPNQEAPTRIFWSQNNRHALIREPLAWASANNLGCKANPKQKEFYTNTNSRQTVEIRTPDCSAFVHLLFSGLSLAIYEGLKDNRGIKKAKECYIKSDAGKEAYKNLDVLPGSCEESAKILDEKRELYEKSGFFSNQIINYVIEKLRKERDSNFYEDLQKLPLDIRLKKSREIMHKYINVG